MHDEEAKHTECKCKIQHCAQQHTHQVWCCANNVHVSYLKSLTFCCQYYGWTCPSWGLLKLRSWLRLFRAKLIAAKSMVTCNCTLQLGLIQGLKSKHENKLLKDQKHWKIWSLEILTKCKNGGCKHAWERRILINVIKNRNKLWQEGYCHQCCLQKCVQLHHPLHKNKKFAIGSRKYIIHVTDHFCTQMILEHHIGYESLRRRTTNRQSQIYITSDTTLSTAKVPAPLRSLTVLTLTLHPSLGHGALLTRKRRKNL